MPKAPAQAANELAQQIEANKKILIDNWINKLKNYRDQNDRALAEALEKFNQQIAAIEVQNKISINYIDRFHMKSAYVKPEQIIHCQNTVIKALEAVYAVTPDPDTYKPALKALNKATDQLPSTQNVKGLAATMMLIGAVLLVVGTLSALVSAGLIATGALAPLGALGIAGGATMAGVGFGVFSSGATLFALRDQVRNPLKSLNSIENSLKFAPK